MDGIFYEPVISGVTMYLVLFALMVFAFGLILLSGSAVSLVALVFEVFP
jgi:hypothetical protein